LARVRVRVGENRKIERRRRKLKAKGESYTTVKCRIRFEDLKSMGGRNR
jgi:hypothetical protein